MKNPSLLLLWLALVAPLAAAGCAGGGAGAPARVAGRWEGAVEFRGARLPLAVNVVEGEGGLRADISSPDMFWHELPLREVTHRPPRLRLEVPVSPLPLVLDGTVKGDTYAGRSREGELEIPFTLKRAAPAPAPPYGREEVRFGGGGVELAGTLLLPAGPGPHPAVVFLHGAGPHPRHDYFFYADLFARRGVAALVYDKRGVGDSTGDARAAGQSDLASDALAAVRLLASRKEIDARRIGLWGQSLGGMVAPLAAARSAGAVAFLILVSPPGVTLGEAEAWDDEFDLRRRGYPEAVVERSNQLNAQLNRYYRTGEGREAVLEALARARREGWAAHTDLPEVVPHSRADSAFGGLDFDLDPALVLEQLKVPVLVIFGERDDRIPAAESAARIEEALRRGGNPDYAVKTFPGADHVIKLPAGPRADTGGRWDWPRPAPGYLDTMLDWTLRQVRAGRG